MYSIIAHDKSVFIPILASLFGISFWLFGDVLDLALSETAFLKPAGPQYEANINGIRVTGGREFISKTDLAIKRLSRVPSGRYIRYIRSIKEQGMISAWAYTNAGSGVVYVSPSSARRSVEAHAATLVHEGAHNAFPSADHDEIYAIHDQALREMTGISLR